MILSFHPCFKADKNIICAGRLPDQSDLCAVKNAKAVILSQGCDKTLYQMVCSNCKNVFPNFDARFSYPGKTGQVKLFKLMQVSHPESWEYNSVNDFVNGTYLEQKMPFIFKHDWGGEGSTVFLVKTEETFDNLLNQAKLFENSGHYGFLIQKYIGSSNRTLRVVVIGGKIIVYWKLQDRPLFFDDHLSKGRYIKKKVSPVYMAPSVDIIRQFCNKTKINLAGFDIIFDKRGSPLLLEINYFFGRKGLGGSEQYYKLLCCEIKKWITSLGLSTSTF